MPLYRLLMVALGPVLAVWALLRVLRGAETRADLAQRLGIARAPAAPAPTLWLHAASNGELASAEAVIRAVLRQAPGQPLLITTNSLTGRALAQSWDLPNTNARLAPFDWGWAAHRLLRRWRITGLMILESELWPNRIAAARQRNLPICVIGARLSRRTAQTWRRFGCIIRPLLGSLAQVVPQDRGSRRRFARLGLDAARLGHVTDLKALYSAAGKPGPDPALAGCFPAARTWLAASTHPCEEEIVLDAHLAARAAWPDLELILAPRHPVRAPEIRALIEARGLPCAQRSLGEPPRPGAVYLADTLGEMPRFYANAAICLVAGSLVDRGGHTPFEPWAFGCVLLHGPHLRNFIGPYARLAASDAALSVTDADDLACGLIALRDPDLRAAMGKRATEALGTVAGPDLMARSLLVLLRKGAPVC